MTHLSRDKAATKMGHPIVVAWSDLGHSAMAIPVGATGSKVRFACYPGTICPAITTFTVDKLMIAV
jgi:hypothetical protein